MREGRPQLTDIKHGWDLSRHDDRQSRYVVGQIFHHVKNAWHEDWSADTKAIEWLDDYSFTQDCIPIACATVLGPERTAQMAQQSEDAAKWWSAALRWSASALATRFSASGLTDSGPLFKKCAAALGKVHPGNMREWEFKDRLEFTTVLQILTMWNPADVKIYIERLERSLVAEINKREPELVYSGYLVSQVSILSCTWGLDSWIDCALPPTFLRLSCCTDKLMMWSRYTQRGAPLILALMGSSPLPRWRVPW
jgi:hypothetical protein